MKIVTLASLGLETVPEVSARKGRGWSPKMIQNRIRAGLLTVVPVTMGRGGSYLLFTAEVDAFVLPGQGRRSDLPETDGSRRKRK